MNTLLVYMVNPQHIQHANAFILASNGRELRPTQAGGELKPSSPLNTLFFSSGIGWAIRDTCVSSSWRKKTTFAFPSYKRSELFKSEGILEKLSSYGRKLEDL